MPVFNRPPREQHEDRAQQRQDSIDEVARIRGSLMRAGLNPFGPLHVLRDRLSGHAQRLRQRFLDSQDQQTSTSAETQTRTTVTTSTQTVAHHASYAGGYRPTPIRNPPVQRIPPVRIPEQGHSSTERFLWSTTGTSTPVSYTHLTLPTIYSV